MTLLHVITLIASRKTAIMANRNAITAAIEFDRCYADYITSDQYGIDMHYYGQELRDLSDWLHHNNRKSGAKLVDFLINMWTVPCPFNVYQATIHCLATDPDSVAGRNIKIRHHPMGDFNWMILTNPNGKDFPAEIFGKLDDGENRPRINVIIPPHVGGKMPILSKDNYLRLFAKESINSNQDGYGVEPNFLELELPLYSPLASLVR